jgi:hypothetical protein
MLTQIKTAQKSMRVREASIVVTVGTERACALSRLDTLLGARLALLSLRSIRRFRHMDGAC